MIYIYASDSPETPPPDCHFALFLVHFFHTTYIAQDSRMLTLRQLTDKQIPSTHLADSSLSLQAPLTLKRLIVNYKVCGRPCWWAWTNLLCWWSRSGFTTPRFLLHLNNWLFLALPRQSLDRSLAQSLSLSHGNSCSECDGSILGRVGVCFWFPGREPEQGQHVGEMNTAPERREDDRKTNLLDTCRWELWNRMLKPKMFLFLDLHYILIFTLSTQYKFKSRPINNESSLTTDLPFRNLPVGRVVSSLRLSKREDCLLTPAVFISDDIIIQKLISAS